MIADRRPFALAHCMFLRGHVLMTAPVPPFRAASHADGDPRLLVAVSSDAEAMGAALVQVLQAGLVSWAAPLLAHDIAAAMAAARAAEADLAKAAKAGKAQARAETGMVWATTEGDGRVLLEPSKQARGTLAFDSLPFRIEASLGDAGETGRALVAAMALCRGTVAFEGTLSVLGVVDLVRIGEAVLITPRLPARSEQAFPHPQAGEVVDMATEGPQALDAALARAIAASRFGAVMNPAAHPTDRRAALEALARAAKRPKAAGASAVIWTVAEVAGSGVWHGPANRRPRRAGDLSPIWRALPAAPNGAHAEDLLGAMSAPRDNA